MFSLWYDAPAITWLCSWYWLYFFSERRKSLRIPNVPERLFNLFPEIKNSCLNIQVVSICCDFALCRAFRFEFCLHMLSSQMNKTNKQRSISKDTRESNWNGSETSKQRHPETSEKYVRFNKTAASRKDIFNLFAVQQNHFLVPSRACFSSPLVCFVLFHSWAHSECLDLYVHVYILVLPASF